MKNFICVILILFWIPFIGNAQNISIGAGVSYGGPIPEKVADNSDGKPKPGWMAGISWSLQLNKRFSFSPSLFYSYSAVDYNLNFTKDTLITIIINNISGQVPSFYTVYVSGEMRLHYINIPLLMAYKIWKSEILCGPYISYLIGGQDFVNVRVVVGTGGFYADYSESYDNFSAIRKLDYGIMIGSNIRLYKRLGMEFLVSRSFRSLYSPDKVPHQGPDDGSARMFNTFVRIGLIYRLSSNE